jgi:hypothetical protein
MAEGKKPRLAAIIESLKASGVKDQDLEKLQATVDLLVDAGIHAHVHVPIDTTGDGVWDTQVNLDIDTHTAI